MITKITVLIQSKSEAPDPQKQSRFEAMVEGMNPINTAHASEMNVCILENGTEGGQNVLGIVLKQEDGTFIVSQMTHNLFESIVAAYNGACMRFEEEKAKKN